VGPAVQPLAVSNVVMHVLPSGAVYNPKDGKASFQTLR
jgi:hypothetical protein